MNELIPFNSEIKMTSVQIAEKTGKEHKIVLRDIRKLEAHMQRLGDGYKFVPIYYRDSMNREKPMYELNEKQTLLLAGTYSADILTMLIEDWARMKEYKPKILTPLELIVKQAELAVVQERKWLEHDEKLGNHDEKFKVIEKKLELTTSKAQMYDEVVDGGDAVSFQYWAAEIKRDIGQNRLFEICRLLGYITKKSTNPYAKYLNGKHPLFTVSEQIYYVDGNPQVSFKTLVTPWGRAHITPKVLAYLGAQNGDNLSLF